MFDKLRRARIKKAIVDQVVEKAKKAPLVCCLAQGRHNNATALKSVLENKRNP